MLETTILIVRVPQEAVSGLAYAFPDVKIFDDENDASEVFVDIAKLTDATNNLQAFADRIGVAVEEIRNRYRFIRLVVPEES